jgi:hypothetical protein
MKKLFLIAVVFFSISAFALPQCPSDQNQRYDNCFGTYTWADGNKYVGEYKDGKRHGQGTYTYANEKKVSGYWMNNEYVPDICEGMGLEKGTDSFGDCVLKLIDEINERN